MVLTAGTLLTRAGDVESQVGPGTAALISPTRPFDLKVTPSEMIVFTIPVAEVKDRLDVSEPLATGIDLRSGLGHVIISVLQSAFVQRDSFSTRQFDTVCDGLTDMLCMLIVGDDRPPAAGHLAEVETIVRRYVRAHADDPELTGSDVARAVGWSLRQVQLSLQGAGTTLRDAIREERLRTARRRLSDPSFQNDTISEVARASGFSSATTFSTMFRQHYGQTPRDFRKQAAAPL